MKIYHKLHFSSPSVQMAKILPKWHKIIKNQAIIPPLLGLSEELFYQDTRCVMKHKCPPYEANSRGNHHCQNPRSRFQNLPLQYKGLVTNNMHMKYKSPITYYSKDMAKVKSF
jgi:hypothetical protein